MDELRIKRCAADRNGDHRLGRQKHFASRGHDRIAGQRPLRSARFFAQHRLHEHRGRDARAWDQDRTTRAGSAHRAWQQAQVLRAGRRHQLRQFRHNHAIARGTPRRSAFQKPACRRRLALETPDGPHHRAAPSDGRKHRGRGRERHRSLADRRRAAARDQVFVARWRARS